MTHPIRLIAASLAIGLAAMPVTAAPSAQKGTVAAGTLTCRLASDTNVIIFSREDFDCTYASASGETGAYRGVIRKLGADLEFKRDQVLKWLVVAPAATGGAKIIGGRYVGGSAEATVGAGLGARVLVGGSRRQFTLQPVSVSGQSGFGASATLDTLNLTYMP